MVCFVIRLKFLLLPFIVNFRSAAEVVIYSISKMLNITHFCENYF